MLLRHLLEASFAYYQNNPYCVAFKQVRGGMPSVVFSSDDGRPLTETERLTVMLVAGRKFTEVLRDRDRSRIRGLQPPSDQIDQARMALYTPDRILANQRLFAQLPEFFKIATVQGRASIYRYLTTDLKMTANTFQHLFGKPPDLTHGEHYQAFHNARLFFPETMRASRQQALLVMLEEVYEVLAKNRLTPVFGCDTRFVKQTTNAAGIYHVGTDDMRISPDANNTKGVVYTILHEYGHRHYFRFLPEEQRQQVKAKYNELRRSGVRWADPQAGERKQAITRLQPGVKLRYVGKTRKLKAIGEFEITPSPLPGKVRIKGGGTSFTGPPSVFVDADWQIIGDDAHEALVKTAEYDLVSSDWFPTEYSQTEYEEWYAECFAIRALGHLHGEVGEFYAALMPPLA
jgi:hypothetical protein